MKKFLCTLLLQCSLTFLIAQSPILYTITNGGENNQGAIVKYDVASNSLTTEYSFGGLDGSIGRTEFQSLVQSANGLIYGTMPNGGLHNWGVIFSFNPYTKEYKKLHDFNLTDGASPTGLIQASNGKLYGLTTIGGNYVGGNLLVTQGTIFSYDIQNSQFSKLHDFNSVRWPYGNLLQARDGLLYGITSGYAGLTNNGGSGAFSYNIQTGEFKDLVGFNDISNNATGSIIQAKDGYFYYTSRDMVMGILPGKIGSNRPDFMPYQFVPETGSSPGAILEASDGKFYGNTFGGVYVGEAVMYFFHPYTYEYKVLGGPVGTLMQASDGKLYAWSLDNFATDGIISYDITTSTRTTLLSNINGITSAGPFLELKCIAPSVSIPDAKAMQKGAELNTVYKGYTPASSIILQAQTEASTSYTYLWSNGATTRSINVSPSATTSYSVTVTNTAGCSSTAFKEVKVFDVRCGNGNDKVMVCKVHGSKSKENVLCISPSAVPAQIAGGAMLGNCGSNVVTPEVAGSLNITATPNPTKSAFTLSIRSKNNTPIQLTIYNAVGRVIETRKINGNQTMQLGSSYKADIYYIEAIQGKERISLKLIKSK